MDVRKKNISINIEGISKEAVENFYIFFFFFHILKKYAASRNYFDKNIEKIKYKEGISREEIYVGNVFPRFFRGKMPLLTQKPSTRVEKTTSMALNFHSAYLRDYVIGSESVNYRLVMRLKKIPSSTALPSSLNSFPNFFLLRF